MKSHRRCPTLFERGNANRVVSSGQFGVIDSLPWRAAAIDGAGRVLWLNKAWRSAVGESQSQPALHFGDLRICGSTPTTALHHAVEATTLLAGVTAVLTGKHPEFRCTYCCQTTTEQRWFELRATPFDGGALLLHIDVTDQHLENQLYRETQNRWEQLFAVLDEGYCIIQCELDRDAGDYRFLEANRAFLAYAGVASITAKSGTEVFGSGEYAWAQRYAQVARSGLPQRFHRHDEALRQHWSVFATRVGDPSKNHVGLVFKNVTAERRLIERHALWDQITEFARIHEFPEALERDGVRIVAAYAQADCCAFVRAPIAGERRSVGIAHVEPGFSTTTLEAYLAALDEQLSTNTVLAISDMVEHPSACLLVSDRQLEIRSLLAVPVLSHGHWTHMVVVHRDVHPWTEGEVETLAVAAHRVWTAVEKKRAFQALTKSEAQFRAVTNMMTQFAWMADANGYIYWYSNRWYDYTGTTFAEMAGWGWTKVHHPDHVARVITRIQHSWDTGENWEDTFPLRSKTGEYRWFLSRAEPTRSDTGEILFWVGTNTDVTEQMETARTLYNREQALAESNRKKSEFLATLSHELRNPLTPMQSVVELLARDPQADGLAKARSILERQLKQLVHLVDDLLELSRIDTGNMRLRRERVPMQEVVDQAVEATELTLQRGNHRLVVVSEPEQLYVNGDITRLVQVLTNIINNAARYTTGPGEITVILDSMNGYARVRIRDTGIGIPPAVQPHIFDMFAQGHRARRQSQNGLGIGLSLARKIMDLHDGTISVHSDGEGRGSEFTVCLPLATSEQPDRQRSANVTGSFAPRKILIVDDNEDAADVLRMVLTHDGHTVEAATDGQEAVAKAEQFSPDLVLMDIGMPIMNGHEACAAIRAQPWGQSMKIVAVTGWGQDEDIARGSSVGFDQHILKPISHAIVAELIAQL